MRAKVKGKKETFEHARRLFYKIKKVLTKKSNLEKEKVQI